MALASSKIDFEIRVLKSAKSEVNPDLFYCCNQIKSTMNVDVPFAPSRSFFGAMEMPALQA